ncbi:MAG: hypothetical protein J5802_12545 [Butyrivibrio sp.]|nr:hypothetical protein [Butyrivibrio sp.]
MKKYFGSAILIGVVLSLTGCGEQFPTLTDEEYNQTVEYAVGLLMKYSKNAQAKLTYVDPELVKKERELEAAALEEADELQPVHYDNSTQNVYTDDTDAKDDNDSASTSASEDVQDVSDAGGADANTDADVNDGAESSEGDTNGGSSGGFDPDAITLSHDQTEEIMDDIFLSYQGYSVSSTYPESSKSYVVNANKGKKLLVLRFDLYNASDSAKEVNMLKLDLLFQIILNGKNIGYSSVTFLPNDLSSYIGTIDSRAHESLAVLTQIDEKNAANVETLGLIITRNGKDQKVNLR